MSTKFTELIEEGLNLKIITQEVYNILRRVNGDRVDTAVSYDALDVDPDLFNKLFWLFMLLDDSGSITDVPGGPDAICKGQRAALDAFRGSKHQDHGSFYVSTMLLNASTPVQPPTLLDDNNITYLNVGTGQYTADGGTPLNDQTVVMLACLIAALIYTRRKNLNFGAAALVVTDGMDQHSTTFTAPDVAILINFLHGENPDTAAIKIAFMGIGETTFFTGIANSMGIFDPPNLTADNHRIFTPDADEASIRHAFGKWSSVADV